VCSSDLEEDLDEALQYLLRKKWVRSQQDFIPRS
jgi:hypothetical protein